MIAAAESAQKHTLRFLNQKKRVFFDLSPHEQVIVNEYIRSSGLAPLIQCTFEKSQLPKADLVVISRRAVKNFREHQYLLNAHINSVPIVDWKVFINHLQNKVDLNGTDFWSFLVFAPHKSFTTSLYLNAKTFIDPILALSLLMLTWPALIVIATTIKICSPGPIFYRQRRAGKKGVPFWLIKFRSMRTDAESNGPQWSTANDNRVYPLGRWLRKTRLDELPQLWNVIKGDLQFIGPRPERPEFYDKLREKVPLFDLRTEMPPGITGWAQVRGGYASTVEESIQKLEYDLYYLQNASPKLDLLILWETCKLFSNEVCGVLGPRKPANRLAPPLKQALEQSMDR